MASEESEIKYYEITLIKKKKQCFHKNVVLKYVFRVVKT